MDFSDNAMSTILLCSRIGIKDSSLIQPLSMGEWNWFLNKIAAHKQQPNMLMRQDRDCLREMGYDTVHIERLKGLMLREEAAALELAALERRGIMTVTIFDADYPILLKRRLGRKAPPVLFYSGDIRLASKIGISVVGSRTIDSDGIVFTRKLIQKASKERLVVYSGGARGVDTVSENTAVETGGAAVSFIADSLISRIRRRDIMGSVMRGSMLLLSDAEPNVDFSVIRAVSRNKYIYAASYGAFVVSAAYNKGGTWSGAVQAIKNHWAKVFVWNHNAYDGNIKLMQRGGIPYELSEEKLLDVMAKREERFEQICFNNANLAGLQISNQEGNQYGDGGD